VPSEAPVLDCNVRLNDKPSTTTPHDDG